jgi:hypothetical protein
VTGEIAPLYRVRGIGAMGMRPKRAQKKGNGLSPSVAITRYPPERLLDQYIDLSDITKTATKKVLSFCATHLAQV